MEEIDPKEMLTFLYEISKELNGVIASLENALFSKDIEALMEFINGNP